MSFRGLYSYIIQNSEESFEPFTLKNAKIIIDGTSVSYQLLHWSQQFGKYTYVIGSDYEVYSRFVADFFKKLILHGVDFFVIMNGCFDPGNEGKIEQKYSKCLSSGAEFFLYKKILGAYYMGFKDDVFLSVMKKLRINFIKCAFGSEEIISATSKILNRPILTSNSAYFLYGNDCILFHSLVFDKETVRLTKTKTCKIYRSDKFIKSFPGLSIKCMPLLSILMDPDYFNDESLKKLLKFESSDDLIQTAHRKIKPALHWLSSNTLESASEKICSLLSSVEKSSELNKTFIEDRINKFTTISPLTLKFLLQESSLQITLEKISLVQHTFFKFTMDSKKPYPNDKLCDKLVNRNSDLIQQKVNDLTPVWLQRCHAKGHIHPFIFSLIGLHKFIPWLNLEDVVYPSAYEISIPLIEFIYRLVLSCLKEDVKQPLKLMTRKNCTVYYIEIQVDRYPLTLNAIRKLNGEKRLKIINNVLRVSDSENFKDLPRNWRLYVATAIFWFKQDVEPKKNKNHLKALLLAMFLDVIKNISNSTKYALFQKRHQATVKNIMSTNISYRNQDNITIIQAFENICPNDAIIAADYLLPLIKNQTSNHPLSDRPSLSTQTIHIYTQFEICLHFSRSLNSLLNLPYDQTIVEKILVRPLIYNLYLDISKHPNADEYIAEKLNHAPTILNCFKILLKKVDSLLNE